MTRLLFASLLAATIALASSPVGAGEAQDRIFRVGLLGGVKIGQSLVYARGGDGAPAAAAVAPVENNAVEVDLVADAQGQRVAAVELRRPGQEPSRAQLPADGAHPVLLMFLEMTARAMAEATGGSPFYIRNRMREALGADAPLNPVEITIAGEAISGEAATFLPFDDDPNRDAMGSFADLALTIVLSDAVPGGFARFEAAGGPVSEGGPEFAETLTFQSLESD